MTQRRLSQRALRAAAIFGLSPADVARSRRPAIDAAAELDRSLRPGELGLIVGPSGGGKSSIAREMAALIWDRQGEVVLVEGADIVKKRAARRKVAVVDLFRSPLTHTLTLLARAGLAEASLFAAAVDDLSDGQRARLAMAVAMEEVERCAGAATLILDEFASTLDRTTAAALSRTLRRWASTQPCRVVCATAHDDLLESLAPDVLVEQPLNAPAVFHRRKEAA